MIGHNWGAEQAERWVWIQASGLNGNEGDYVDIAAGRIKVGGWTTPWVANGRVVIEGEPYRVGGFRPAEPRSRRRRRPANSRSRARRST